MLVQIEVREDSRGLNYYCGELPETELDEIVCGKYLKAFVHLRDVFWPASQESKNEFDPNIDYVVKFGVGDRANFTGDMYVKLQDIVLISPLRGVAHRDGRKLGDLMIEKKKKGA